MRNRLFKIMAGVIIIAGSASCCYAAGTSASSTVSANIPVLNTVENSGGSLSISIDPLTGSFVSDPSSTFKVFTNNKDGIKVQFSLASASTTGSVNASVATAANSNSGKAVFVNSSSLPTSASVANALLNTATPANNPNAVAYNVQFTGSRTNTNPVYKAVGDTFAEVTAPVGVTTFTAQFTDGSNLATTYDSNTDYAGAYQTTVSCTVSNP